MNIVIINIGIIARILSVLIVAVFVLPKQIEEARLKNGLRLYRHGLLLWTSLFLLTAISSLVVLFDATDGHRTVEYQSTYSLVHTINTLVTSLILFSFYNSKDNTKGGAKK